MANPVVLGGYSETKDIAAQCVTRGGKTVYILSLPISLVPVHLSVPDPTRPIDSNRAVSKSHAESFGDYWLKHPSSWTVPPILVDTLHNLEFDMSLQIDKGPKIGVVKIPDYSNQILRTLDGQHRILGWTMVRDKLISAQAQNAAMLQEAKNSGTELERQLLEQKRAEIKNDLDRMHREQVTLEIITGVTDTEHKTFFVTIADNAQGINTSERTRLDEVNMTSRVAKKLAASNPLVIGRIEERKASAGKNSGDLMSIANLRNLARHVCFGIKGKETLARERELNDSNAFDVTESFLNAMIEAAPQLKEIIEGTFTAKSLRQDSLLGSITIWRCLAGAYHEIVITKGPNHHLALNKKGHDDFVVMATQAVKKMKFSTTNSDKTLNTSWFKTECFNPGELAPRSRAQDLKALSALFTAWSKSGTVFDPQKLAGKNAR